MSSVNECMRAWGEERPATPEKLRKWRSITEPGARVLPPGQRDADVDPTRRFGAKGSGNRDSGIFSGARPASPLRDFLEEQQEAVYRSRRRPEAPPVAAGTAFGRTTVRSEDAGAVIWAAGEPAAAEEARGAGAAGRPGRRPRGCSLAEAGVDRETHRFGARKPTAGDGEDVAAMFDHSEQLERERGAEAARETRRAARRAQVPDIRFGRAGEKAADEWDAGHCINGEYGEDARAPDRDLGVSVRSLHPGANLPVGAEDRRFGAASIRRDRPPPRVRSVADATNYGDEDGGKELLYPHPEACGGVADRDFCAERAEDEARGILADAGMAVDDATWAALAAAVPEGKLTVAALRDAYNKIVLRL